jgi:hypothetical protein
MLIVLAPLVCGCDAAPPLGLPPLDLAAPDQTETATFALG